jgi:hypothetical protein
MAQEFDAMFKRMEREQKKELEEKAEYYSSLKRTGGSDIRIDW